MRTLCLCLITALLLALGSEAETLPPLDKHVMTVEERELWKAAAEHFQAEPETLSVCHFGGKVYGESDRRGGGTCRNYGLWVMTGQGWLLVAESLSLEAASLNAKQSALMQEHGVTSEVLEMLSNQSFAIVDELPAHWNLDIGYKLRPVP
jgi:hypothetical protein